MDQKQRAKLIKRGMPRTESVYPCWQLFIPECFSERVEEHFKAQQCYLPPSYRNETEGGVWLGWYNARHRGSMWSVYIEWLWDHCTGEFNEYEDNLRTTYGRQKHAKRGAKSHG